MTTLVITGTWALGWIMSCYAGYKNLVFADAYSIALFGFVMAFWPLIIGLLVYDRIRGF